MDVLDRKPENVDTFVPPEAPLQDGRPVGRSFARKARILLVAATAAVTVGLHVFRHRLYASEPPEILVHPAAVVLSPRASTTDDFDWDALEPSTDIKWTTCYDGNRCARLLLPLDYLSSDPNGATTAIAMRMIPARDRANYRGTVLVNPGGPGGAGTEFIATNGDSISTILGETYDVLGFDPRGIGASTPRLDCFASTSQRDIWELQEGSQLFNPWDDTVLGLFKARYRALGERCAKIDGGENGIARFMSTASVATDMLKIAEKLGEEKLNYWGFSYGSVLGQYFAAMYPDKVGRFIIDGVFDAENYRSSLWSSNIVDSEAVIDTLFTFCHQAGPQGCALYEPTPSAIRERYYRVLNATMHDPIPIPYAEPPVVFTHKVLVNQLFQAAYTPLTSFPTVVETIRAIETGNETALTAIAEAEGLVPSCDCARPPIPASQHVNDALPAVACGDAVEAPYNRAGYRAFFDALVRSAPTAAPLWAVIHLECTQWPVRPKWRYTGPLSARNTSHPILILSGKYDPVTPVQDALKVSARYAGSRLVIQDSRGHCTLAAPSMCTAQVVHNYMVDGVLPKKGTVCQPDELPFNLGNVSDVSAMSTKDKKTFRALKSLGKNVPTFRA